MSVVIHSFISGQPFRLRALRRALDHIVAHAKSVWITQPGEIAAFFEAHPDLTGASGTVPDSQVPSS
jgi:hypothetical protein